VAAILKTPEMIKILKETAPTRGMPQEQFAAFISRNREVGQGGEGLRRTVSEPRTCWIFPEWDVLVLVGGNADPVRGDDGAPSGVMYGGGVSAERMARRQSGHTRNLRCMHDAPIDTLPTPIRKSVLA